MNTYDPTLYLSYRLSPVPLFIVVDEPLELVTKVTTYSAFARFFFFCTSVQPGEKAGRKRSDNVCFLSPLSPSSLSLSVSLPPSPFSFRKCPTSSSAYGRDICRVFGYQPAGKEHVHTLDIDRLINLLVFVVISAFSLIAIHSRSGETGALWSPRGCSWLDVKTPKICHEGQVCSLRSVWTLFHGVFLRQDPPPPEAILVIFGRRASRCNAAFAILYCAEAVVPEGIVRLYAVVTITDLVIRPRGWQRGSANSDLDRSKLRFVYLTVDSPRLETQDEEKAVLRRHQKPSLGEKGEFPRVGTQGECRHSKQQRSGSTTRTNSKGDPRTPSMPIKVRTAPINVRTAPSWKSFSSLEGTRWI